MVKEKTSKRKVQIVHKMEKNHENENHNLYTKKKGRLSLRRARNQQEEIITSLGAKWEIKKKIGTGFSQSKISIRRITLVLRKA